MKSKDEGPEMDKLMRLTKLMKDEKIKVKKMPTSRNNKWRSEEPKFSERSEKPADLVQGGGMNVDPSRKEEYDAWRKAKEDEQNSGRPRIQRTPKI
jgi:hypothetical protein